MDHVSNTDIIIFEFSRIPWSRGWNERARNFENISRNLARAGLHLHKFDLLSPRTSATQHGLSLCQRVEAWATTSVGRSWTSVSQECHGSGSARTRAAFCPCSLVTFDLRRLLYPFHSRLLMPLHAYGLGYRFENWGENLGMILIDDSDRFLAFRVSMFNS